MRPQWDYSGKWDTCKNCKNYIEYICSANKFMYAHSQVCLYKKVLYKRDKIIGKVSLWSSTFTLKKYYYVPFDKLTHSDLNDQNLFHSTIDVPPGVPDNQTEVHSGELEH